MAFRTRKSFSVMQRYMDDPATDQLIMVADVSSLSNFSMRSLGSRGCFLPQLLHHPSLYVMAFIVSSEYPSSFTCNNGDLLSQCRLLVHHH